MTENKKKEYSRFFTLKDQNQFAELSGDFNPIHICEIDARRTIAGECICHGINSFLWALECLTKDGMNSYCVFKVRFVNFIPINKTVDYFFDSENHKISIYLEDLLCVQIKLYKNNFDVFKEEKVLLKNDISGKYINKKRVPEIKEQLDIKESDYLETKFFGNEKLAKHLFPNLVNHYGKGVVCQICSLSEIIGMRVPGMFSIFSKANIKLKKNISNNFIKVANSNSRFKRVNIHYLYPNIEGEIEGFFRPRPVNTLSLVDLKNIFQITKKDYLNKKVLIIGGSRGLGSCAAKLIAMKGGTLTITYNKGFKEANVLKQEINNFGIECSIYKYDIFSKENNFISNSKFDQLYYFASPRIKANKNENIDKDLLRIYQSYYFEGFKRLINLTKNCGIKRIFYPSTIYIDKKTLGFKEYILAKIEGEEFCDYINQKNKNIRILKPRLPKVLTDQTISILPSKVDDINLTLMKYIDEMNF